MAIRRVGAIPVLACATLMQLAAPPARAQVCAGSVSLRERPVIVTADAASAKNAWSVGAGLTAGRSAFVGAFVERVTYQDVSFAATQGEAHSNNLGGAVGYEFRLGAVGVCPVASALWESGPDGNFAGNRLNSDGWTAGAGVSVGGELLRTATLRLFPFASATIQRVSSTVHDFPFVGTDTHAHDTGFVFGIGFGVAVGSRVTLGPSVSIPSGIEGGETTVGFSLDVGLGGARR